MEVLLPKVAGVDVHKDVLAVTILIGEANQKPVMKQFTCATFTSDLEKLGHTLLQLGVRHVAMESTGVYWKPVFHVLAPMGVHVTVGNASHMRNVPGRKTDAKDSEWIANLHRNGLIRPSYIPEAEFQELRALTRHRKSLVEDLARVKNRVQKVLEDANVKLKSVINDVFGVGGTAVIEAIAAGETNAKRLACAVKTDIKRKDDLEKALTNTLTANHCFLIKTLLSQCRSIQALIGDLEIEIDRRMQPYQKIIDRLVEIPGLSETSAKTILAEATASMDSFREDRMFAAWAGVAPGNNESAGKKKKARSRKGNPHLKRALIQAAQSAIKKKKSFYLGKHNQLRFRLGSYTKATVAIANRIARVVYHIISDPHARFKDLGEGRADPREQQARRALAKLRTLGYKVEVKEQHSQALL